MIGRRCLPWLALLAGAVAGSVGTGAACGWLALAEVRSTCADVRDAARSVKATSDGLDAAREAYIGGKP